MIFFLSAQHGYVRRSNGKIFPIDWTDFHLSKVPVNHMNLPKALAISFSANGEMYLTTVYVSKNEIRMVGTVPRSYESNVIRSQIGK